MAVHTHMYICAANALQSIDTFRVLYEPFGIFVSSNLVLLLTHIWCLSLAAEIEFT